MSLRLTAEPAGSPSDPTDEQLIGSLESDGSALASLYDRHAALVYGLSLKVLGSPDEAQDLTQEIFLMLCKQSSRYDPGRGSVAAFLVTMTRTRAIDRLRRRTTKVRRLEDWRRQSSPDLSGPGLFEELSAKQSAVRVRGALDGLPANERRALEMAYFQGLTQAEIAAVLETPLGTVKSWCRRGLLGLKEALADLVK